MTVMSDNDEGYRNLASAILLQAVNDLKSQAKGPTMPARKKSARDFLLEGERGWSAWLCDALDIPYQKLYDYAQSLCEEGA